MKKSFFLILVSCIFAINVVGQKAEVLYFKANLGCCAARACENLETSVKAVVEENFDESEVVFRTIMLTHEDNADIVKKYNAGSQTVVIVNTENGENQNVTDLIRNFRRTRNNDDFQAGMISAINKII